MKNPYWRYLMFAVLASSIVAGLPGRLGHSAEDWRLAFSIDNAEELVLMRGKASIQFNFSKSYLPDFTRLIVKVDRLFPNLEQKAEKMETNIVSRHLMYHAQKEKIQELSLANSRTSFTPPGYYRVQLTISKGQHPRVKHVFDAQLVASLKQETLLFIGSKAAAVESIFTECADSMDTFRALQEIQKSIDVTQLPEDRIKPIRSQAQIDALKNALEGNEDKEPAGHEDVPSEQVDSEDIVAQEEGVSTEETDTIEPPMLSVIQGRKAMSKMASAIEQRKFKVVIPRIVDYNKFIVNAMMANLDDVFYKPPGAEGMLGGSGRSHKPVKRDQEEPTSSEGSGQNTATAPSSKVNELDDFRPMISDFEILTLKHSMDHFLFYLRESVRENDELFDAVLQRDDKKLQSQLQQEWQDMATMADGTWTGIKSGYLQEAFLRRNAEDAHRTSSHTGVIGPLRMNAARFRTVLRSKAFTTLMEHYIAALTELHFSYAECLTLEKTPDRLTAIRKLRKQIAELDKSIFAELRSEGTKEDMLLEGKWLRGEDKDE